MAASAIPRRKHARRRVVDQFRRRNAGWNADERPSLESLSPAQLESVPDPVGCDLEAIWDEEWERSVLAAVIERVKR